MPLHSPAPASCRGLAATLVDALYFKPFVSGTPPPTPAPELSTAITTYE